MRVNIFGSKIKISSYVVPHAGFDSTVSYLIRSSGQLRFAGINSWVFFFFPDHSKKIRLFLFCVSQKGFFSRICRNGGNVVFK